MVRKFITNQYLKNNKKIILLKNKKPLKGSRWNTRFPNDAKIYRHDGNLGWCLGKSDLIVDVDPRNGGQTGYKNLMGDISCKLTPVVNTPGGGFHIYLKIPEKFQDLKFRKSIEKKYPGVDFLTKGAYVVICDSKTNQGMYKWVDEDFGEFEQRQAPEELINIISNGKNDCDDDSWAFSGESNTSEEEVLEMLSNIEPSMPYDEWVKVGMALFDWDTVRGIELWEEWSKGTKNYTEHGVEDAKKGFKIGGGITLATIHYMVKDAVYDKEDELVLKLIKKIKKSSEKEIEFKIYPKVRKLHLNDFNKEKVVKAIQDRYKESSGVRVQIAKIRQNIVPDIVTGEFIEGGKQPEWCKNWVYVNVFSAFVNLKNYNIFKSESFNILNGKYVPSFGGSKQKATSYVSDFGFVEIVNSAIYLPSEKEMICNIDGSRVLNMFDGGSVPKESKSYTERGLTAIDAIKKHIKFVCVSDENSEIIIQWLAHQIQFPGKLVLWAPLIQSIDGVGKSFFGEMLRCCMGDKNIGVVSPSQLTSEFNGWATNVVVNVLEELRIKGHNRYEAINAIKNLITDRVVQINDKRVKAYQTYNTTNYICFTNHKDSLPLDDNDRRWFIIFNDISNPKELNAKLGGNPGLYFKGLFKSLIDNKGEIRKWLLDYKISEKFMETKQAPMTEHKKYMIATENCSVEGLSEIRELIKKGNRYFNETCISSSDLFEKLVFEYPNIEINSRGKHAILKKLGYLAVPNLVKIHGKNKRIWSRKVLTNSEIRDNFKNNGLINKF